MPQPAKPVKLVMSFLFAAEEDLAAALSRVDRRYGPVDFVSETLPFSFTRYYEAEMGGSLRRRLASFSPLISPEELPEVKAWTNSLENEGRDGKGGRRVNIDPGYMAAAQFILATGKNYSHRIHLRAGIYGDLTLIFREGKFTPLPWTYPDYASPPLIELLQLVRRRYLWQLRMMDSQRSNARGEGEERKAPG